MKKYIYAQYSFANYWKANIQIEQTWKRIQDAYKGAQQMGQYQKLYVAGLKYPWQEEYTDSYIISMHKITCSKEYIRHESYIVMDVIPTMESVAKKLGYNRKMTEEEFAETNKKFKEAAKKE